MADTVFEFGEPAEDTRNRSDSWTADEAATKPIDEMVAAFAKAFAKNGDGYKRSVVKFDYPALELPPQGDATVEDYTKLVNRRTSRIAERINLRTVATATNVHARVIRGVLHLVVGVKPKIERKRKPAENSPVTAGAE